ncbi:hypothetical protein MML48_10g00001240 [Holotrichia oblita]|uniref:Uncharacterized protein n=1 Tax=Holotrichia oblita TaxID=644536 RepID=A0ACB9SGE5_HOLOL|nr:hypothetical protein MML48_10g00001240 [Holotrichia oblita]
MKNKFYDVEISIDLKKGEVVSKHCSCPRGLTVCHHMASLLYSAHYNVSSTDIERSWGTAQSKFEDDVKTVEEIYGHNEPYTAIQDTNKFNKIEFKEVLGDTNVVGFSWLLKPEQNSAVTVLTVSVEEFIFSQGFIQSSDKLSLFKSKLLLSCEEIQKIAAATVGQNRNEAWLIARKHRLTASKFGRVLKACQRSKFPPSFYKSILEGYDFNHALAVQWGVSNENLAREKFKEIAKLPVYETGLWLHECGYLGGSPDGLIGDNALLEIKCPYSMRNVKIEEHLQTHKYFFKYEDGAVVVDKNHEMCVGPEKDRFLRQEKIKFTPINYNVRKLLLLHPDKIVILHVLKDTVN